MRLLALLLPEDDRAAVLGDFEEMWARGQETPHWSARLVFWVHAFGVGFGFARHRLGGVGRRSGNHTAPDPYSHLRHRTNRSTRVTAWSQDVRIALRTLRKRPLFTGTVALTLALGIGATTAVFSTADALLFRPLPFPEPDELLYIPLVVPAYDGRPELEVAWSYPKLRLLLESTTAFEGWTTYQTGTRILTGDNNPEEIRIERVGPGYFGLLGVEMAEGRTFRLEEDGTGERPFVAVLSHDLWVRRYGGDPGILGSTIQLNEQPHTVVGIARPGFPGLSGSAETWIPVMTQTARVLDNPDNHAHELFVRLREGGALAQAQAQLQAFAAVLEEAYPPANPNLPALGVRARPLRDLRSDPSTRQTVLFLLGAVVTVLLIACSNLSNLLLERARRRRTEMAIRSALGAGRSRIVKQLMTEGLVLAGVGGALGTVLAAAWMPLLRAMGLRTQEVFRPMDVGLTSLGFAGAAMDVRALLFSAGLCLAVAVLLGLAPAILASRPDLVGGLKGSLRRSAPNRGISMRGRSLVVASQLALAFALLTSGGLMLGSLTSLIRSDIGIGWQNVLTARISLPQAHYSGQETGAFWEALLQRVSSLPTVHSVGINYCPPLSDRCTSEFIWFPDRPPPPDGIRPMPEFHRVGGDYFGTLGIPLLRGRLFEPEDQAGQPLAAVVGESAARAFWPGEDPLGKAVTIQRTGLGDATVVGVVRDVRYGSIDAAPRPSIYVSLTQVPSWTEYLVVRPAGGRTPVTLLPSLRELLAEMDPNLPLTDVKVMSERVADATSPTRFTAIFLSLFAAAGLTLSVMGIFGVLALVVGARTHELGVRRTLGAGRGELFRLVLTQSGGMIVLGIVLGAALSWVSSRFLEGLLFGLRPFDPGIVLGAAALLSVSALMGSLIPALRASSVDPMVAIRQD